MRSIDLKNIGITALALCALLALGGCAKNREPSVPDELKVNVLPTETEESVFPVTVGGAELYAAAERVVSLSPAVTEIIAEMGFADRLCGISTYCDYPALTDTETVGSSENPDLDKITAIKPDLVFTLSGLAERDIYALNSAGIAVAELKAPQSLEEYALLYRDIAAAFYGSETDGSEKEAERAAVMGNSARSALEAAAGKSLGSFVYVTEKLMLAGENTFEDAVLSLVGDNLCRSAGYTSPEDLGEISPRYIVADSALSLNELRSDEAIAAMLDKGAVPLFVTSRCFERPTARTAEIFGEIKEQMTGHESGG